VTARRVWAWPLVPLYGAGLAAKDGLRAAGVLSAKKLQWPVVSVGSLSAGGAGKTPVVIALAELLRERGRDVDVLSRGYGRSGRGVERVDPAVADAAARFGDEPVVIAQRTRVPVWVGAERFAAGTLAEAEGVERGVHLLDDGFQHRALARVLDVVLVTEEDLDDALLPAGNLREPLSALTRADVVVVREDERERVEPRIRGLAPEDAGMWSVRRELRIADASDVGSRPVAFCAIARPAGFSAMLERAAFRVIATVDFGDHDRYDAASIDRLIKAARDCEATGFLTTEKDAVKLSREMMHRLEQIGPVTVVGLDAKFVDEARVMRDLEARIS
jgi:tetraacyldisaccharide 4'-kinase